MVYGNLHQLCPGNTDNSWIYGNPNITFFKTVFKKHTNFAMNIRNIPIDNYYKNISSTS